MSEYKHCNTITDSLVKDTSMNSQCHVGEEDYRLLSCLAVVYLTY